jgi:hypothetical protein
MSSFICNPATLLPCNLADVISVRVDAMQGCSPTTLQLGANGPRQQGAVAGSVLIWLERITNVALTAATCRRLRTVPFYRTSDGSRIHSRIARSLPLDLSRLAAKGVAIHPRK